MAKYTGKGDRADLDNHSNQLNPTSNTYKSSRSGGGSKGKD